MTIKKTEFYRIDKTNASTRHHFSCAHSFYQSGKIPSFWAALSPLQHPDCLPHNQSGSSSEYSLPPYWQAPPHLPAPSPEAPPWTRNVLYFDRNKRRPDTAAEAPLPHTRQLAQTHRPSPAFLPESRSQSWRMSPRQTAVWIFHPDIDTPGNTSSAPARYR